VIGDEVDQETQTVAAEGLRESDEGFLASELATDGIVIGDVVAVRALRAGLEEWGDVAVRNPQGREI